MSRFSFILYFALNILSVCLSNPAESGAIFIYPNASSRLTFNYLDTVDVVYSTPWPNVNLWVYCLDSTNSPYHESYQTDDNPLHQSGTVKIERVGDPDDLQDILQYPTSCWFKIADASLGNGGGDGDKVSGVTGGNFTIKSVDALPTQTWNAEVTPTTSDIETSTTVASVAGSSSSGLSTGAKAGIGAGVGLLCLILVCLGFYIFTLRRRLNLQGEEVRNLRASQNSREPKSMNNPVRGTSMTPGPHA